VALQKLEAINLTSTAVDDAGVAPLRSVASLKNVWTFDTKVSPPGPP
jgi:hypothetical protein